MRGNNLNAVNGTKGPRLLPIRKYAAALRAFLPFVGAAFLFLFFAAVSQAQNSFDNCDDAAQAVIFPSPIAPWKGAPLRVILAVENPLEGELSLIAPDGSVLTPLPLYHIFSLTANLLAFALMGGRSVLVPDPRDR